VEEFADIRAIRVIRPLLLGIASSIPGVSGIVAGADAAIQAHIQDKKQKRLGYLIEDLASGVDDFGGPMPMQMSDPVIHAAYVTIEATLRTSRRQKIRAFARLLQSGLATPPRLNLETEHEDYLKILDDLSLRGSFRFSPCFMSSRNDTRDNPERVTISGRSGMGANTRTLSWRRLLSHGKNSPASS
jgi:hypothetical protein